MKSINDKIVSRISALLSKSEEVLKTKGNYGIGYDYVDKGLYVSFWSQAITCLNDILGPEHPYLLSINNQYLQTQANPINVSVVCGVLRSFKEDLEEGYLQTMRELVHAEVFTDFVEMAQNLLNSGYKDAVAVIVSVLENHLRQLAFKNGIDRPIWISMEICTTKRQTR